MDFLHHGTLVVFVLFLFHHCCSSMRYRRDNSDHFNIMLSLFKVKPLENSKVYKAFSNTMLLPASDPIRLSDIKFDVKEFDKYFDNKHKTEHGYTEYKDSPIIQEKLKQEPIKHNIIEHSAEPRFEAVDKLEFFDERDPISAKLFTKEDLNKPSNFVYIPLISKKKKQYLSDAEVFIPDIYSKVNTKRLLRSTEHNFYTDGDETDGEYTKSSKEPLII